jgi:hypothetical protein
MVNFCSTPTGSIMLVPCTVVSLCCGYKGGEFREMGRECGKLASETAELAVSARSKGERAISDSNDVGGTLTSFGKVNADTFVKIKGLINDDKAQEMASLAGDMEELADGITEKADAMMEAVQRGIDSLPDPIKDEITEKYAAEDNDDDDEEMASARELLDVDSDLQEVETSSRSVGSMNIFTAAVQGQEAFGVVTEKENVCMAMFDKIRGLTEKLIRLCRALAVGTCCEQLRAAAAGAKELFQCLRLSKLIKLLAQAAKKLIQAIARFVKLSWEKFRGFLAEFDAAKRLGRFLEKVNPMNTAVGQAASGVIGGLFGGSNRAENDHRSNA